MRITNVMMTNTTLININRNMRHLDNIIRSIESNKKIQVPSDDPIIASRALKFRTSVIEIEQFQRNVQTGMGWMEVTESAFMDITRNLLKMIGEKLVEGATLTEEYSDKLAVAATIREMVAQIQLNMNQTYAGRYVFSGYRTNEPPIFVENSNKSYMITQSFNLRDIEKTIAFHKPNDFTVANEHKVNILKLAYKNMGTPVVPGYEVVLRNLSDPDAYRPPYDNYDAAVLAGTANNPWTDPFTGGYGGARPTEPVEPDLADPDYIALKAQYDIDKDIYDHSIMPLVPPVIHYIPQTGELVMHNKVMDEFKDGTTVTYRKDGFQKGELNPIVYFDARELIRGQENFDVAENIYRLTQSLEPGSGFVEPLVIAGDTLGSSIDLVDFVIGMTPDGAANNYIWKRGTGDTGTGHGNANPAFTPVIPGFNVIEYNWDDGNPISPPTTLNYNPNTDILYDPSAGTLFLSPIITEQFENRNQSITVSGEMPAGAISPSYNQNIQFAQLQVPGQGRRLDNADPHQGYHMNGQEIQFEFSTNTYITINSLAKNVYTDQMYSDLKRLLEFVESLESSISDPKVLEAYYSAPPDDPRFPPDGGKGLTGKNLEEAITKHQTEETALLNSMLQDRFNNMLYLHDRHAANALKEHTQLGSRMLRMELLQIRLEEDEGSYTKLMSDNEDTDMARAIILKAAAEAAYAAALRASSNIMQLTLANFIG